MRECEIIERLWKLYLSYYSDFLIEHGDRFGWNLVKNLGNLPINDIIAHLEGKRLEEFMVGSDQ